MLVGIHILAPGQGLIGDAHAILRREVCQAADLRGEKLIVIDRRGAHVGAQQDQVHAQALHQLEFCFGTAQVRHQNRFFNSFKIAEGLKEVQAEPEPCGEGPDFFGRHRADGEILFEDLNAVKACLGAGKHFFFERAREADGSYRSAH